MKRLFTIFLGLSLILPSLSRADEVQLGTSSFHLAFADTLLSIQQRTAIANDINLILSTSPRTFTLEEIPHSTTADKKMRIDFGTAGHYWPRPMWESGFGKVYRDSEQPAKLLLHVPKNLSDVYIAALSFFDEKHEAMNKLEDILAYINSGLNYEQMSLEAKKSIFWFPPDEKAWVREDYYDKNLRDLQNLQIHKPSLLEFKKSVLNENEVIFCEAIIASKDDTGNIDQHILVFSQKQWRLAAF